MSSKTVVSSLVCACSIVCFTATLSAQPGEGPPGTKEPRAEPRRYMPTQSVPGSLLGDGVPVFSVDVQFDDRKRKGDPDQCAGGVRHAKQGNWTEPIAFSTGGWWGGCYVWFAVRDPRNLMAGLTLEVGLEPVPQSGAQCAGKGSEMEQHATAGLRTVQITRDRTTWSAPMRIDTDDRGQCIQTWKLTGNNPSYALDVQFFGNGCDNVKPAGEFHRVVPNGEPLKLTFRTNHGSSCTQRFRISRLTPGT